MLPILAVAAVVATIVSAWSIDIAPPTLIDGLDEVANLLGRMFPPRLDDPGRIGMLAVETLLMAVLGRVTTVTSLFVFEINPLSLFTWIGPSLEVFTRMIPPNFDALGGDLFSAALQTVAIGVVSTAIGVVLSSPVGSWLPATSLRIQRCIGWPGAGSWRFVPSRN